MKPHSATPWDSSAATAAGTWHLLGAGALGGLWAMRLSARVPVRLLLRRPEGDLQALRLRDAEDQIERLLPAESVTEPGPPIQHLLVATKAQDTLPAIEAVRQRLHPATRIYLMQNGLGSHEAAAEALKDHILYAVTTTEGANRTAPFHIIHAGRGQTWVGPLTERASLDQAEACAELFTRCGLASQATADIREKLWRKLAVNCAINPFTALLDCPNGELPRHAFFNERIAPLCEEIAQAMTRAGYPADAAQLEQQVRQVIAGTAANISSMLQDIRGGRRTEIDAINGYLTRFCQRHGLSCPINQELEQLVKNREAVYN